MPAPAPRRPPRLLTLIPVAVASLVAVMAAQTLGHDRRYLVPLGAGMLLMLLPAALGRWRMRRLLMSGDVQRVIGTWAGSLERVPHPETMAPLLQATAYASYGWIESARRALGRAVKGPAWDAAVEQRLFVETLLDTFEGDRDAAMRKAQAMRALPMPSSGVFARRRVSLLRDGLAALARAFAHASVDGDAAVLRRAAAASPLVHWAMRYAAAIVALDQGRASEVASLISRAPPWPVESAFAAYHRELLQHAAA
jgi:hypothetical protein